MERIIKEIKFDGPALPAQQRVAAYARVSSGKEAMLESLSAQVSYYSEYIQKHADWEYVGTYSDEAYTGTKASRPGFQRLLADCRSGIIEMVITKSISRFARNTVTLLNTVRELKSLGVDVFFEKENIHSISADGEFMITILASYAQEESYSVSENCKWRIRKKFEEGKPETLRFIFGYTCSKDGLKVIPEEAAIVRTIFSDYINGMGLNAIMKKLNADGFTRRSGKAWSERSISNILHNEKFCGNTLCQKTYVENHITKRRKINRGKLPMFFAKGTHEAIVPLEIFEQAQTICKQRAQSSGCSHLAPKTGLFSGKITCGICGKAFCRKSLRGGQARAWVCSTYKTYGKSACPSKQIPEEKLLAACADVLRLEPFCDQSFTSHISRIEVSGANKLTFIFNDGRRVDSVWKDRSRSESWTDEMREIARVHQKRRGAL